MLYSTGICVMPLLVVPRDVRAPYNAPTKWDPVSEGENNVIIEENLPVHAPAEKIWNTMMDVPFLVSCVPGIEKVEAVDANNYKAVLKSQVAFITATFDTTATITEMRKPEHMSVKGEGKGRLGVGRISFNLAIDLKPVTPTDTNVVYKLELNVVGRLATVGGKAIARKTNEISQDFRKAFAAKCEETTASASSG